MNDVNKQISVWLDEDEDLDEYGRVFEREVFRADDLEVIFYLGQDFTKHLPLSVLRKIFDDELDEDERVEMIELLYSCCREIPSIFEHISRFKKRVVVDCVSDPEIRFLVDRFEQLRVMANQAMRNFDLRALYNACICIFNEVIQHCVILYSQMGAPKDRDLIERMGLGPEKSAREVALDRVLDQIRPRGDADILDFLANDYSNAWLGVKWEIGRLEQSEIFEMVRRRADRDLSDAAWGKLFNEVKREVLDEVRERCMKYSVRTFGEHYNLNFRPEDSEVVEFMRRNDGFVAGLNEALSDFNLDMIKWHLDEMSKLVEEARVLLAKR